MTLDEAKTALQVTETPAEVLQVIARVLCKSSDVPSDQVPTEAGLADWFGDYHEGVDDRLVPLLGPGWKWCADGHLFAKKGNHTRTSNDVHDAWRFGVNLQEVPFEVSARQAGFVESMKDPQLLEPILEPLLERIFEPLLKWRLGELLLKEIELLDPSEREHLQRDDLSEILQKIQSEKLEQDLSETLRKGFTGKGQTGFLRIAVAQILSESLFEKVFKNPVLPPLPPISSLHPHPLVPLVQAWQQRPRLVRQNKQPRIIVPESFRESELNHLPSLLVETRIPPQPGPISEVQMELPLVAEKTAEMDSIVPVLPITLYDAAGGTLSKRGGVVPYELRILFESLFAVGQPDRQERTVRLEVELREIVDWLWPKGWQRGRDLPKLRDGLLELRNLRIYYDGWEWFLVDLDRLPTETSRLDETFHIDVRHLPDSGRGPLLNRDILRMYGAESTLKWRSYIRLSYIWDRAKAANGGWRIYATRPAVERGEGGVILNRFGKPVTDKDGRPETNWKDPRAVRIRDSNGHFATERHPHADRVPLLVPNDLIRLCYDENSNLPPGTRRERLRMARKKLREMDRDGMIVIEDEERTGGMRILEPWLEESSK